MQNTISGNQMNPDLLRWGQGAENASYPDVQPYNMNNYGVNQPQYDSSIPAPSTQLARRPLNHHLVPTSQRTAYENSGNSWTEFGDDQQLDPQNPNSAMEENDNIELLEERAVVAKREAISKRKQIPPFVQKLSR
jgi:heat shock transcription factor